MDLIKFSNNFVCLMFDNRKHRCLIKITSALALISYLILLTCSVSAVSQTPVFSELSPGEVYAGFVYKISLFGDGFEPGATVNISMDSYNLTITDLSLFSNSSMNFNVSIPPAAKPGLYDITITNPDGKFGKYKQVFSVMPPPSPNITNVSPMFGMAGNQLNVTITGQYFRSGAIVTLSGHDKILSLQNPKTSIGEIKGTFYLPVDTNPGLWDLIVTNPDGKQGNLSGGITITMLPPPEPSSIAPNQGDMDTPVPVVITGKNFLSNATVSLERSGKILPCEKIHLISNSTLTCIITVPEDLHEGMWDVNVRNPDGQTGTLKQAYLSGVPSTPMSLTITPAWGVQGMNREVCVTGMAFLEGDKITINKDNTVIPANNISIKSGNEIICLVPIPADAPTGVYDVVITSKYGKSDRLKNGFYIYSKSSHLLAGMTPSGGEQGETVYATLSGYNLPPGSYVNLTAEGSNSIPVSIVGDKQEEQINVSFIIPDNALVDYWDLKVKTPDGLELKKTHAFRVMYNNTPEISTFQPDRAKVGTTDLKVTIIGKNFGDGEYVDTILTKNSTYLSVSGATSYHGTQITGYLTIPNGTPSGWYNLTITRTDVVGKPGTKPEIFRVL